MKVYKGILIVVCLICLVGCGKKDLQYVDSTPTDSVDNTKKDVVSEINVDEKWEEKIDVNGSIKINVEPKVPDVLSMKVIDVEKKEYKSNPKNKEEFLETLTVEPMYKYDEEYWSKEEWEKQAEGYYEYAQIWRDDESSQMQENYDYYIDLYNQAIIESQTAEDDYVLVDDYLNNRYKIKFDDKEYIVTFSDEEEQQAYSLNVGVDVIRMELWDKSVLIDDSECVEKSIYVTTVEDYVEPSMNECNMTEEEAGKVALDFIDVLDVGDFQITRTKPLQYSGSKGLNDVISGIDGYVFYLTRDIENLPLDGNVYTENLLSNSQAIQGLANDVSYEVRYKAFFEEIVIGVNDEGIVFMDYYSPYEIKEIITDDVNFLSFDNVKKVICEELTNNMEIYYYAQFNTMELTYFPIQNEDDENKVVIIPVWKLTDNELGTINSYVIVNAIDGSIINVGKQVFDIYELDTETENVIEDSEGIGNENK